MVMLALSMVVGVLCSWTAWAFTTTGGNRAAPIICLLVAFVVGVFFTCFIPSDAERLAKHQRDMQIAKERRETKEYDAISDRIAHEAATGNLETCIDWIEAREKIK